MGFLDRFIGGASNPARMPSAEDIEQRVIDEESGGGSFLDRFGAAPAGDGSFKDRRRAAAEGMSAGQKGGFHTLTQGILGASGEGYEQRRAGVQERARSKRSRSRFLKYVDERIAKSNDPAEKTRLMAMSAAGEFIRPPAQQRGRGQITPSQVATSHTVKADRDWLLSLDPAQLRRLMRDNPDRVNRASKAYVGESPQSLRDFNEQLRSKLPERMGGTYEKPKPESLATGPGYGEQILEAVKSLWADPELDALEQRLNEKYPVR